MYKQSTKVRGPETGRDRVLRLAREFRLHSADNRRVVLSFFIALDSPIALSCYLMYKYEEYDQLVSKEISPFSYNDGKRFRDDFAAISFLRKHETLKTSFDRKQNALTAFAEGELACNESNKRIRRYLLGCNQTTPNEDILSRTIRKIDTILGTFDIDKVLDLCSWGPGVTLSVKGEDTSGAQKFDIDCDITKDAYAVFGEVMLQAYPLWDNLKTPSFKTGNKIITVPKNAKTDRTIAIEPGLNSWLQSGIGRLIRRKLRFSGYNLNSDLKNHRGAFIGSLDDSLATVDFKAASDTISTEVMRLLLPPTWFTVLNAARSHHFMLGDQNHRSEKFSTMGNGFTFELESLVFLAIGLAVCDSKGVDDVGVSIFGDDLIIPSPCMAELTAICTFLGFTINSQKSFSYGPFRESCGQYFYDGLDVKPLFFKTDLLNVKDLYRMANATRNLSHSFALRSGCDLRFRSVWSLLLHFLPSCLRLLGPVAAGDAAIHQNIDDSLPRKHPDGWCGFLYTGIPGVPIDIEKESRGLLLTRLRTASRDRSLGNYISLRERTRIVYKKNMFVHWWYDFGPWVSQV